MPTALTRIQVSQTAPVARALEIAEREWPGVPRAELIARLIAVGGDAVRSARTERREARRKLLEDTRGIFGDDVYPPGYLEELRKDWPE